MQNDEIIWQVINSQFCSFKAKLQKETFCRNQYNITGLCNRNSCPLANSRYATILEKDGVCWLYIKTIERAHTPKNLWERIKLSKNYLEALKQIDKYLEYWPEFMIHKAKQRLTKIRQYLIRMRKLKTKVTHKLVTVHPKIERREKTREKKALIAAAIENKIKNELVDRLKRGIYDQLNIDDKYFQKALDKQAEVDGVEADEDVEYEDEEEEEEEESGEEEGEAEFETVEEYVEDLSDMEDGFGELEEGQEDEEKDQNEEENTKPVGSKRSMKSTKHPQKKLKGSRVIEYEDETVPTRNTQVVEEW